MTDCVCICTAILVLVLTWSHREHPPARATGIRCTDQTSTEHACAHTPKLKDAQHYIQWEGPTSGSGKGQSNKHNQQCEKNEGHINSLKDDRWSARITILETIRQEKTTRETSQAVKRRSGQILGRHDLAENSSKQARRHVQAFEQPRDTTAA